MIHNLCLQHRFTKQNVAVNIFFNFPNKDSSNDEILSVICIFKDTNIFCQKFEIIEFN